MVKVNKLIFDYDQLIICGPVFPHEVVGFSGGNKYFFPGIAGPEIIDFTHWLGALMTNYETIGKPHTPIRAVIDRAAEFIDRPVACFSLVVTHAGLAGILFRISAGILAGSRGAFGKKTHQVRHPSLPQGHFGHAKNV